MNGDFSAPDNPRIYDPRTYDAPSRTRQPFPGNRIPATRFSPRGVKIGALFPKPNFSGLVGRNYSAAPGQQNDNNQGNLRVDHRFSDRDSFFFRYSILDSFRTRRSIIPFNGTVDDIRGQNVPLNWVRTLSPGELNEVRLGFNRNNYPTPPEGSPGPNASRDLFGFTNTTSNPVTSFGLPLFSFTGYTTLGPGSQFPQVAITQTGQIDDNFTLLHRNHSLKVGFDIRRTRLSQRVANNDRGSVTFTGQFSNQPSVAGTGNAIADLLLGVPLSGAAAVGDQIAHNYNGMYAFFFQDDWKISSRLTLNLGVRYEYIAPWREKLNRYTVVDPDEALGRLLIAGTAQAFVPGRGIVDTGQPPVPKTILRPDRNNWAPRVGFAYRPLAKTVLRGGYGIFYDVQEGNEAQFLRPNPPFFFVQNLVSDPLVPTLQLDALFPPAAAGPTGVIQPFSFDPTARIPYIQQWNFNIERGIMPNLLIEVGYLGSKGTHLLRRSNFQQGPNILVRDPANPAPLRDRVRYPNFSPNLVLGTDNGGSSSYHGLIGKLERRFQNGLALLASYTFSKTIDDTHSSSNFDNTPQNPQCRCDLRAEKGLSAFHVQQRFIVSYTYELPIGAGKPYLNYGGRVGKLVSGWQLNGITAFQSGPPFTINTFGDNANIGVGSGSTNNQRPNLVGDPQAGIDKGASIQRRGVNAGTYYFNRSAFVMPPLFRLGNLGKNTLVGPGVQNWDFSVFKNTAISEKVTTQFRAEFFNTLNHPNFGVPGRILGTPTFGVITGAGPGRIIQFALKVLF